MNTKQAALIVIRDGRVLDVLSVNTKITEFAPEKVYRFHHTIFPNVYAYEFEPTGEIVIVENGYCEVK